MDPARKLVYSWIAQSAHCWSVSSYVLERQKGKLGSLLQPDPEASRQGVLMRLRATPCPTAPVQMTDSQAAQQATSHSSTVLYVSRFHAQTKRAYACILSFRMGCDFCSDLLFVPCKLDLSHSSGRGVIARHLRPPRSQPTVKPFAASKLSALLTSPSSPTAPPLGCTPPAAAS